jgi:hypothetical protein
MPVTKAARELGAIEILRRVFLDDQEIVAAGVGLGEWNQSSSQLHDKGVRFQVSGFRAGTRRFSKTG